MRVMIVEDEPNIVESLSFVFSREGWQVAAALDGETAIERLMSEPPDVLVLDIMLPPLNGFEVLKRSWLNLDLAWTIALIGMGAWLLFF